MLALRSFARALPRAATRLPATRVVSKPFCLRPSSIFSQQPTYKAFSTSIIRREPTGEYDQELSAKFDSEHQLEVQTRDPSEIPESIDYYLKNSGFEVEDRPGTQDVVLTKQFGNETIKIEFSIADMNNVDEELDQSEDDLALEDEDFTSGGKRTINQSGTKGGKVDVTAEDSIAPADRDGEFDDEAFGPSYPLNLAISITKPGQGATVIRAEAQSGSINVSDVHYYPKAELIDPKTPEEAREASAVYEGPPFINLDPDLQSMLERYIEERGINAELASFLPEYVDFKEQREYVQWLNNMKKFIDA